MCVEIKLPNPCPYYGIYRGHGQYPLLKQGTHQGEDEGIIPIRGGEVGFRTNRQEIRMDQKR